MRRRRWLPCGLASALLIAAPTAAADLGHGDPEGTGCVPPAHSYASGGAPGGGAVDDPLFARQWGLDQVNAPEAWARGARGEGAVIAVIDTGVDLEHPDLKDKLVGGIDLVAGETDCPRGPQDEHGRGTHVAGIAAAATDNGIGIAGVAPRARIMPVRVLDAEGVGSLENIAAGIRWAVDNGAHVLNLSFAELPVRGQDEAINSDIEAAVNYAWAKGAVIVAAGGDAPSLCSYPSYARQAICVPGTDRRGLPAYYSSLAGKGPERDASGRREPLRSFRGPGGAGTILAEDDENVWGPIWPGAKADSGAIDGYDALAGTAMATPFVSGVAALLVGQGLTNQQIIDRLAATAFKPAFLEPAPTFDPVYGFGIVDADAATAG
ncbi:MAG TPA: S8 family serine peptidase [Thermoleophilaceae bacterium]|nr:S8 family serine peptidase [Thermoleophilaceae bacterium]